MALSLHAIPSNEFSEGIMTRMSTKTHGVIDYVASGIFAILPKAAGFSSKVTALLEATAGSAAMYSAITNYELGMVKMLPMKAHLALDALSGGMLLGAAMIFDDEDEAARATLAGIGLFEIAAALTTQTRSTTEQRSQAGRRGGNHRGNTRRREHAHAHA
jgi:hypothetical protein